MTGTRQLAAGRAAVWTLLNDSEVLKACVPGCESLVASGEHAYEVAMHVAIGPVKTRFKGRMSMTDIDPPAGYRLSFEGQSTQAGCARGEARVQLEELGPEATRLVYAATAQIGGRLAQVGARLVDAAAAATADKFFEAFAAQIASRSVPAAAAGRVPPPQARLGLWSWLRSFLRHLFRHR